MILRIWGLILFRLFIWSGKKMFGVIALYNPGGEIKAVHFAINEWHLDQSISKYHNEHTES